MFCILILNNVVHAQGFMFDGASVPTQWSPSATGSLSLSAEHYKEGSKSLCWTATGTTSLTVTLTSSIIAGTSNGAYLQIYSSAITNDTLSVEFLNNSTVMKKAVYLMNYRGWHEFNRAYTEYASNASTSITSIRFTLKPTSATSARKVYFDNVDFNHANDASRFLGSHWVLDSKYFNSTVDVSSLSLFANPIDIAITTPTAKELADLKSLQTTLKRVPTAGTAADLAAAKAYVNSLNIVRNPDGSVVGSPIDCSEAALTDSFMIDIAKKVEILAAAALTDPPTKVLFQNFVDFLLDQGISEGCNYRTFTTGSYTSSKDVPAGWLDALPACTADEKAEIVKLVKWFSYYGTLYYPQNKYLANLISDNVYLFPPHMLGIALNQPDDATCVRELKAFKRYMDRNTEYVPGEKDILKPDGSGFHHKTQYSIYMYAYKTWVQYLYYLKGTQFQISADSYKRLKKAIITTYVMGTLDTGDNRYFANSLNGRRPCQTQVQFTQALFDNLIAIGGDILGMQDNELAAAYNYFFKTTKYTVPAQSYEGFYQFNYSPTGIYRKGNWVATMHAPTANFWGSEIFDDTNRFGRYQSHGALEIMYGGTLAYNGYPASGTTTGGWDWNIVPGATVVQYTSWQEMMPYKSLKGRFDQKTLTKNFSGALSFGDCGIFACDFDQIDTWGASAFTPTNLVFKKSMFAFDGMIFSLGSNITSSGTYSSTMTTSTNLFQCLNPTSIGNVVFNGTNLASPYTSTVSTTNDNWLITPQGTGYFIPKGNDNLDIRFQNQTTPFYTGVDYAAPTTTVMAAKAYLNHGVKPSSKTYSFVAIPATNTSQMQTLATQMANGGGSVYQILSQSASYHALLYKPKNITAYSFFGAASGLTTSTSQIVKSTTSEHLLMDKYDVALNRHSFAICNPNLHPQTDAIYGWVAVANQTTLTLVGEWKQIAPVNGVTFSTPTGGQTQVTVIMYNGEPIYFGAMLQTDVATINPLADSDWVCLKKKNNNLEISFPQQESGSRIKIEITDLNGRILMSQYISQDGKALEYPIGSFKHGFFICTVSDSTHIKTFKFSN